MITRAHFASTIGARARDCRKSAGQRRPDSVCWECAYRLPTAESNLMRLIFLAVSATLLPFFWGWAVYWLIRLIWPERPHPIVPIPESAAKSVPLDFQI